MGSSGETTNDRLDAFRPAVPRFPVQLRTGWRQPARAPPDEDVARLFTGEYRHAVDGKGRIAVPARFRARLDGGGYVARWIDGCLALFPKPAFEELGARVAARPVTDANARGFARFVFSGAFEVELDGQGRILVPAGLRAWAGIAGEALVVGALERLELWAPERWDAYRIAQAADEPEAFAARLQDLGI